MPGLTRDRREGITNIFGFPVRLVDTAGVDWTEEEIAEELHSFSELSPAARREHSKRMRADMIR